MWFQCNKPTCAGVPTLGNKQIVPSRHQVASNLMSKVKE